MRPATVGLLLNGEIVECSDFGATTTVLDFLRLEKGLTGTKEGCAEGDCGACTVLVGRVRDGALHYESINACICFVASLHGSHLVTIEHLAAKDGTLHPVQQAMVDHSGSQCGFCTPGIVMSLYGLLMANSNPTRADVERALQGNLCRCTGYAPIVSAALAASDIFDRHGDVLGAERQQIIGQLGQIAVSERINGGPVSDRFFIPADVNDLAELYALHPQARLMAGSTDVGLWVTKHFAAIAPVIFIGGLAGLCEINEGQDGLTLGAGVSYTHATAAIKRRFPQLVELWDRIGGAQVRNMGTVGGNIANGSPIGDTPPPLIALGASITLRRKNQRRTIALEDYFIAYGKQDRQPGEFIENITIPYLPKNDLFACYKISKRRDEDISAVCGAFRVTLDQGEVRAVRIAFGGMAAIPKRAKAVEAELLGQPWTQATMEAALGGFSTDFSPISDMRASAQYRALVAENLLRRFFMETKGAKVRLKRGAA